MSPECSAVVTLGQNDDAEVGESDSTFVVILMNAAPWATSTSQKRHLVDILTRSQEAATWLRLIVAPGLSLLCRCFHLRGFFFNCNNFGCEECKYIH